MRFDETGLFWNDYKPPRVTKERIKRIPPDPVWLKDDYLPYLDEALAFDPPLFTDSELIEAALRKEPLVWDIESYPNYWSVGFMSIVSGKCVVFESSEDEPDFNKSKLDWVARNFKLIDFNGEHYDRWILNIAVKPNTDYVDMFDATERIINWNMRGWEVCRNFGARKVDINHIDLFELTKLSPSLKTMAGRLGSGLMMDLPFKPGTPLNWNQQRITFWYMFNDLRNTLLLYNAHLENIKLRENLGPRYNLDLRSKSDAQMAEAIFRKETFRRTGKVPKPPQAIPGYSFKFQMPSWIQFLTKNLQWVRSAVENADFIINDAGYVVMPEILGDLVIPIGAGQYKMGIGGLHSHEESTSHVASNDMILKDFDVPSYYPKLILATGLYPPSIGPIFIPIFSGIVDERLEAKARKEKTKADALKIVVNGTFGKTLDPYSVMYYPELGIQTTLTGQLALLMLIERVTLAGFEVVSANTDGVVIKASKSQDNLLMQIIQGWEQDSGLELEPTEYYALLSRDVNNYIAIKPDGTTKSKGLYGKMGLEKNPQTEICWDAIVAFLTKGTPIEHTIRECRDINKFVSVRNVRGGCAKIYADATEYVGKVARWAYFKDETGEIVTCAKGHIVPQSEGARPIMRYNDNFPEDLDYNRYIQIANEQLTNMGYNHELGNL
jgi:hypothetical protein